MQEDHGGLRLTRQQEVASRRVRELILSHREGTRLRYDVELGGLTVPREEDFGTFGLFGARGSGKSTVLAHLVDELEGTEDSGVFVCWPPLDCTTLAPNIPLAISLMSYVVERVPLQNLPDEHNELVQSYFPQDRHYRELLLGLAVTVSEYTHFASMDVESRRRPQDRVSSWLDSVFRLMTSKSERILVVLEDADLAIGKFTSQVIGTFLTDFSDQRLMFLLIADDDHLGRRFIPSSIDRSAVARYSRTSDRLLAKLIPSAHRVYIESWVPKDAADFVPFPGRAGASGPCLRDLLEDHVSLISDCTLRRDDLERLLPRLPRGLNDFYRNLRERSPGPGNEHSHRTPYSAADLLAVLARCRQEALLAKRLSEQTLDWWASRLVAGLKEAKFSSWSRTVEEARQGLPIWALESEASLALGLSGEPEDSLWLEVLVNVACRRDGGFLSEIFLPRFGPLAAQLPFCGCEVRPDSRVFADREVSSTLLGSRWFRWSVSAAGSLSVKIGWSSLVEETTSRYLAVIFKLSSAFGVSLEYPHDSPAQQRGILPADLRSLLILIDEISQLPWVEIQDWAEDSSPTSVLRVLPVLCLQAYAKALDRIDAAASQKVSFCSARVFSVDLGSLRNISSAETELVLQDCRSQVLESCSDDSHPLVQAARDFVLGSWYGLP